jgi:Cytochrome c oxidase subunit III.
MSSKDGYYIPHRATWPWVGTVGLAIMLAGFANVLNDSPIGKPMMIIGFATVIIMMVGWFTLQAIESESGMYNAQVSISYRLGMMWFIFSEVDVFCGFSSVPYTTFVTCQLTGWAG